MLKLKKNTRFKSENYYLTLRRQLPKRDAEYYCSHRGHSTHLFWLKPNIELIPMPNGLMIFKGNYSELNYKNPKELTQARKQLILKIIVKPKSYK